MKFEYQGHLVKVKVKWVRHHIFPNCICLYSTETCFKVKFTWMSRSYEDQGPIFLYIVNILCRWYAFDWKVFLFIYIFIFRDQLTALIKGLQTSEVNLSGIHGYAFHVASSEASGDSWVFPKWTWRRTRRRGGGMGGMPLVVKQEAFLVVNRMTNKTHGIDDTEFLLFANPKTAQKSR